MVKNSLQRRKLHQLPHTAHCLYHKSVVNRPVYLALPREEGTEALRSHPVRDIECVCYATGEAKEGETSPFPMSCRDIACVLGH